MYIALKILHVAAVIIFLGNLVTGILWNTTARKIGLLPNVVPKIGAILAIILASIAIYSGNQPLLLQIATYAAGLCLFGSFMTRWAALPALIIAAIGVAMVFAAYVRMADGVTWQQATGMVAFGLAGISSLMILVEHKDEQCV